MGPNETSRVNEVDFAADIISRFQANSFEVATGEQDDSMRVALFVQRQMSELANDDVSNDTKWFSIMGQLPLRAAFEKALNLPSEFGQIDIDQQLTIFKQRAREVFGSDEVSQFSEQEAVDDLVTQYVARSQLDQFRANASSASIALTLLQA